VECPVNRGLAKVEVLCKLLDHEAGPGRERRVLQQITSCTFGRPDIACHPACEDGIRRLVEY
jgi:hypothetical protein